MAFNGGSYDTFARNAFDNHDATASFYAPEAGLSGVPRSTRAEFNTSIDEHERDEPQDADYSATMGQHWSNNMPWAAKWSFPNSDQSIQSLQVSASMAPGLSSRSTSRRSSFHPPFTPTPAERIRSPIYIKSVPFQDAANVGWEFLHSGLQDRQQAIPELITEQARRGFDFSPDAYSYDMGEASAIDGLYLNANQEVNQEEYDRSAIQMMPHGSATSTFRRSNLENHLAGVWEMNDDRSWVQRQEAFNHEVELATGVVHPGLDPQPTQPTRDARGDIDLVPGKLYTPVYCDQCGVEFNGKFKASNLGRHRRSQHAEHGPRKLECRFCRKTFRRSDARLGHERKQHNLLL